MVQIWRISRISWLYQRCSKEKKICWKKNAEKRKKAEEKQKKKDGVKEGDDKVVVVEETSKEELEKSYNTGICQWLINFFKNQIGEDKKIEQAQTNTKVNDKRTSKVDEDIKKGLLKEIVGNEQEDVIGLGGSSTIKPKNKGGKVKKPEKQVNQHILNIDISVIKQIKELGLTPPSYKPDVPAFLQLLQNRLDSFMGVAQPLVQVKQPEPVKQEPVKPQEPVKQQEKQEQKKVEKPSPEKPKPVEKQPSPEKPKPAEKQPTPEKPKQEEKKLHQ